jgi:ATP-dependent DNA helicase PIF1
MENYFLGDLNEKQRGALNAVREGHNLFLTGPAGSGKSFLINVIKKLYSRQVAVTSTTGVSAVQLSGKTIHSWAGIGLGKGSVDDLVKNIKKSKALYRWKYTKILIIDEISMLSPELFDKLCEIGMKIRDINIPFGGIQLILCGDFLQLPVINSVNFCFEANYWDRTIHKVVYLDKILRQKNKSFAKMLEKARLGICTKKMKILFLSRCGIKPNMDDGIIPTRLYSKNMEVDTINNVELGKLEGNLYTYNVDIEKRGLVNDKLLENFIKRDKKITLKLGAQVMLTENIDVENGLANGSRGVVVGFANELPIVKFKCGVQQVVGRFERTYDCDNCWIKKRQVPLRLAWAITIHKCQGMTLDCIVTNLHKDEIFEYSMAYVALSRVKSIEGLFLDAFSLRSIKCHPKALEFYQKLSENNNTVNVITED